MVEHWLEEPGVLGSIPRGATKGDNMKREVLFNNKWLRVVKLDGWFIASEAAQCINDIAVAVLPYRKDRYGTIEYLSRFELNPAHLDEPGKHQVSIITGACETGESLYHAKMEVLEETGYDISEDRFIPHGIVCPNKTSTTKLHLFSVRILAKDKQNDYTGDGSNNEAKEYADWVSYDTMLQAKDPYIHTIMMRM